MHPSLDHENYRDTKTVVLRQRLQIALAHDLSLPAHHAVVAVAVNSRATVARPTTAKAASILNATDTTRQIRWGLVALPAVVAR